MSEHTGRKQDTRFKPGQSGNPAGRPKGARSKLQGEFLSALAADFDAHGKQAIEEMRSKDPSGYVKTIASLLPKQLEIERPLQGLTDDDLIAAVDALQSFLGAPGAGKGTGAEAGGESPSHVPPVH